MIAGVLLLVNIFVMLAEERKGQLGMMRAVGMRRAQLVRAFLIEGSLYAVVASLLGAIARIGVGAAIVQLASSLFTRQEAFALELRFSAGIASILGGFMIGLLISAACSSPASGSAGSTSSGRSAICPSRSASGSGSGR